jgi:hypothetical protein
VAMQSNTRVPREDADSGKNAGLSRHPRVSKRQLLKNAFDEQRRNPYGDRPMEIVTREETHDMARSMLS